MKNLNWPSDAEEQRSRVLAIVDDAALKQFVAVLNIIAVQRDEQFHAVFGRIDLTPAEHAVKPLKDRVGQFVILGETVPAGLLATRLRNGMSGDTLFVSDRDVKGCNIGGQWHASAYSSQLSPDNVHWPCTVLSTSDVPLEEPAAFGVMVGTDGTPYSGLFGLIQAVSRFDPFHSGADSRRRALHIVVRPFHGRISRVATDGTYVTAAVAVPQRGKWKITAFNGHKLVANVEAAPEVRFAHKGKPGALQLSLLRDGEVEDYWASEAGASKALRKTIYTQTETAVSADFPSERTPTVPDMPDPKKVFIIHGRNVQARIALEQFLRALNLQPLDFEVLAADTGAEFVGNIVLEAFRQARGIIVLFTPDEHAALIPSLRGEKDSPEEQARWQSRPNVIFEAGIAFASARERTALVTMGPASLFSDVSGIHVARLSNDVQSRRKLRQKLIGMGCEVDQRTDAWVDPQTSGDFEACVSLSGVSARDPFRSAHTGE